MKLRNLFLALLAFFCLHVSVFGQGINCPSSDPFCTGTTYTFPNSTGTADLGTIDCCLTTPNPAWYFMELDASGNMTIEISQTDAGGSGLDVDFVLFGPYASMATACATIPGGPVESCSYLPDEVEYATITGGVVGEIYVLLLTNYSDDPGTITFEQTGGTASADCSILCGVTGFTATPGACNPATNQYTVNGTLSITSPPATGTVTFTNSCGGAPVVVNAPFPANIPYSFTGLPSNGAGCTVSATFSADGTCNSTVNYTAPAACTTSCSLAVTATPGACNPATNLYNLNGTLTFSGAPASGTLTVTNSCGGSQVFNAPFASPLAYSITGLNSNGAGCTVTATFSATPACTANVNYTAPAACTTTCVINNFTANISAPTCGAVGGTYGVSGVVETTGAPATGTLTVSTTCGGSQVFNAPFAASIPYNLVGLNADGANCTITAVFSAAPGCTQSIPYVAPSCPCNMDSLSVSIGACDGVTNTYEVDIHLVFSSPPATGTLDITVCGVTQSFNPPFVSPMDVNFSGLATGTGMCNVDATFSADPTCTNGVSYVAPADCSCPADAGTFTGINNGDGTTNVLCFGDDVDIFGNGDFVPPNDVFDPTITYDPGLWLMVYSCPPTVFAPNELFDGVTGAPTDPCFIGIESTADGVWNIANTVGDGTTLYYVPITMYSMVDGYYSVTNSAINCYDLGTPVPITFLPEIIANGVENCAATTVTVTISGGHPQVFGTQFTASNLVPASASFVNTTCGNGGTITITGLADGDNYSFDITDDNGCPITFSGGPFTGPDIASITPAGPFCATDPAVNLVANIGGGTWSGTGITNATAGTFDPATAGVGTWPIVYTLPGCSVPDTIDIIVLNLTITSIDTVGVSCFGLSDGTITINAPGASQFSIDGGATFQASNVFTVPAGTYNVVVQSAGGCSASGTATVNEPALLTINTVTLQNETCAGACDGQVVGAPAGGVSPYVIDWTGTATGTGPSLSGLCTGTYTATVTDDHGCTANGTTNVTGPVTVVINSVTPAPASCAGLADGSLTINASGGTAPLQYSIDGGTTFVPANVFNSLPAGNYVVVVEDNVGCSANANAVITEPTAVAVFMSPDVTICIGQNTNITATGSGGTGPYNYAWDNGLPATATNNVSPSATTIYNVSVTDASGCGPANGSVTVTVNPPLSVTALSDQTICPGASAFITANGAGGNGGPYTYSWSSIPAGPVLSGQSHTVSPAVTTDYIVTVNDGCGTPVDSDTITIGLYTLPMVVYSVDTTQGCDPLVVNFDNLTAGASSCQWNFGDGGTSNSCNTSHVFTEPGCYDITLTVQTIDNCTVDTTIGNQICVFPVPVADFTFTPNPANVFDPLVNFTNLTIGGNTYSWDFDGLGSSTLVDPAFLFPEDSGAVYNVCLSTVSNQGCVDSTCHNVIIESVFLLYVPNTFTPDGDGRNDIFIPILQGEDPASYELFVFNRWGEVIFQSNNKLIGWDGTHNGIKSKEDVYVWKLRVRKDVNQEKVERFGHITLLR